MGTLNTAILPILSELGLSLEEFAADVPPDVVANLRAKKWSSGGYLPILIEFLSGAATLELTLVELVERHNLDQAEGAFAAVMSNRLEELAIARKHDDGRALLWHRVSAVLARHCLAARVRDSGPGRASRAGRGDRAEAQLTGVSEAVRGLRLEAARSARGQGNILITGETGVGKERVVQAIHAMSQRRAQSLVVINCAAIAPGLVDSELFGHRKGAFTGATRDYNGMFRAADKGVLFLDEIAEMPLESQAKLLRVLEHQSVRPVGDVREYPVDVRVISATNRDVEHAVADGHLRQDLYYRLRVHHLIIPPLRERAEDIPLLIAEFLAGLEARGIRVSRHLSDKERQVFVAYQWPGNIRQLRACVEEWADRAGAGGFVLPADLQRWRATQGDLPDQEPATPIAPLDAHLREHVRRALSSAGGNRARAADILGISRSRLYRFLEQIGPRDLPKARRGRPRKN